MDLQKVKATSISNEGAVMHVRGPVDDMPAYYTDDKGVDQPVTITILGPDSDVYHKATLDASRKFSRKRNMDPAELETAAIATLARCIVSWSGFFEGATPVKMTYNTAVEMLTEHRWLRDQVREFQDDRANFFV